MTSRVFEPGRHRRNSTFGKGLMVEIKGVRFAGDTAQESDCLDQAIRSSVASGKISENFHTIIHRSGQLEGNYARLCEKLTAIAKRDHLDSSLFAHVTGGLSPNEFNRIYDKRNFRVSTFDISEFLMRAKEIGLIKAIQQRVPNWKP